MIKILLKKPLLLATDKNVNLRKTAISLTGFYYMGSPLSNNTIRFVHTFLIAN